MALRTDDNLCLPDSLVTAIYDVSDCGNTWEDALEQMRVLTNSQYAGLRSIAHEPVGPREKTIAVGPRSTPAETRNWQESFPEELIPAALRPGEVRVSNWNESTTQGSLLEFRREYSLDWSATACLEASEKSQLVIQISRTDREGAFSAREISLLQMMVGHFARSVRLRRRIANAKVVSDFQAQALDRLGIGGILVDPNRIVSPLNHTAQRILDANEGLRIVNHRLCALEPAENEKLQLAIKGALECRGDDYASRGLLISRARDQRRLSLVVSRRCYQSLITDLPLNCALIFFRTGELLTSADTDLTQQLFGFTPAEAKVAVWLASGMSLERIEDMLNIRHNTARAHLRSIFGKTDVTRRSELIQLLAGSAVPLGRSHQPEEQLVS
jgi:DNA-binding CsgD family transcriptional regulator